MARPNGGDSAAVLANRTTLATFDRPRGPATTLQVLSDTHLSPTAHGTLNCFHRTKQRLEMALADAHRLDVDGVVVAGDLTKDGADDEFALAKELLRIAPRPTVVVPGNHDISADGDGPADSESAFARRLGREGYPATTRAGGTELVAVDSTSADSDRPIGGAVGDETRSRIRASPTKTPQIGVMHHPLGTVPGRFEEALPSDAYQVREPAVVADAFVAAGVDLVITGHVHWPYADEYRGLNLVGAPSTASFPPSYLLVHVDERGTTVELVPLAGEVGLTEAYEFAAEDEYRREAIRGAVSEGYFGRFPMVEQTPSPEQAGGTPASTSGD